MSIIIKNTEQINGIRRASQIAAQILNDLGKSIKIGMTTQDLDDISMKLHALHNVIPATLGYNDFPKSICTSINDVVCHGIPGKEVIKDGDIINIDVTCIADGFFGDTSSTFFVGNVSEEIQQFVKIVEKSMYKGIKQVYPGNHLSNIGYSIQKYVEKKGYSVVRDYCGHGIGIAFHEEPQVLHFGRKNRGLILKPGMVFTIEPMINIGKHQTILDPKDGWTVYTKDGSLSAQFEHTVLVTEDGYEILTQTSKKFE